MGVKRFAAVAAVLGGLLAPAAGLRAQPGPIASGALQIQGNRLTLYADDLTTDADQTINVGERARVRTCFGSAGAACGAVAPGDPRVAGLLVRAELRGPEVPQPIALETVPGGTFVLPGFQQEGDYRLENIRLVEEATGRVLGASEPPLAVLHVREILLASASVRTLSLEELRARGITFTAENFQAFNFAVGFAFGEEIVEIELPLVYSGYGTVQPLAKPKVNLDGLPPGLAHTVERWQPPHIVPFKLEREERELLEGDVEEDQELVLPLFGAIVIPGTVSYLNQFFEAKLVVANGAPAGSDARLEEILGSLRLPSGNVLRVAATHPAVGPGQGVPVVDAAGGRTLFPGDQGSAAWTVEGLAAGTHTLLIDITATLARPGREPLPMLSRIQAAVEVVDARFNLTFSHPDVVREGEAYSLFVTVTNLSRATQNLITVDLDEQHITGAHRADPNDPLRKTIEILAPGQAETLEYRLVADLDGKVVATTFQSSSAAGQGTIRLRTGVGELGIPLSPATLVLPRFSERLRPPFLPDDALYRAHTRFLGLAYSLAVAPAALTPPGLPRVIKSDVERRAVDFAQAGMRTYLHEPLLESLEVLALDYLGSRHPLLELDELRRSTEKGLALGGELGRLFRIQQDARALTADELLDHFAETTTYTSPYLAALLVPDGGSEQLRLAVRSTVEGLTGSLAGFHGQPGPVRTLPFGEVFAVRRLGGGADLVPLAVVGHVGLDQVLEVVVENPGPHPANGRLVVVLPEGDGSEDRRLELDDLAVPAGGSVVLRVGAAIADPRPVDGATGAPAGGAPDDRLVVRPRFRLIGAVQDFRLKEEGPDFFGNMHRPNRYGNGVVYLFNRPPDKARAEDPAYFRIRSTFNGIDTAGKPASGTSDKLGTGAWVQDDERVVAVRYATPLAALVNPATQEPLLANEHLLDTTALIDAWGETLDPALPPPAIETAPLHVGGLVSGRVVRGTGEPVAGATVKLIRTRLVETMTGTKVELDFLGEVVTGADGVFYFDFIEIPSWDRQVVSSFTLRAIIPAGDDPVLEPEERQEISSTIRLQNRMARINIALLGRGTVSGRVIYADDGSPVAEALVRATSTLFNEEKGVRAGPDGSFVVPGVPVGPITLTARDGQGRVVYATVGVAEPGDAVEVLLRMPRIVPGLGTVAGVVVGASDGLPVTGARVSVYSQGASLGSATTDDFGRFRFERVPEGQVSVQAANWAVSRIPVFTDLLLAASETREVELRLPQGEIRTVTGLVLFHDPVTNTNLPVVGAVAFIAGPGVFGYTDGAGRYRIEGVPVQGAGESYQVKAIDFTRKLEGTVGLPPILDVTPDPVEAQSIVLEVMSGGLDGVVLDPLGRPLGGAEVVLFPYGTTVSAPNGSFSFHDLPLGGHSVVAHFGDGLQPGRVGWIGDAGTSIVYGGHRPFVSVRLRGSGVVTVVTRTATSTGILTPIYYKPTYYSDVEYRIRVKGAYVETSTDQNGRLELNLPVGDYELIAYNPFHGMHTIHGEIEYAGQVVHHEIVFEDAATVEGQVVGVDGVTPVPGVEVVLEANGLKGQKQRTDPQGRFRYELVPKGRVMVTAQGLAGSVERVGRTMGYVGTAGQTLELVVQMKAQGTVSGRVMENFNGAVRPLPHAHFYLQEDSFPFRRIPEEGTWLVTDAQGRYQVSHVYAGGVTVVARDSGQVGRYGQVRGELAFDWQVLGMPDVVMTTSVGSLRLTVRNPITGGPVPDAQVRLSDNEATVTDADGVAFFDALPLGTYSIYAFYAPIGQSGRLSGVQLSSPGQQVARTVYLDQRGDVRGTLWNDAAKTERVPGGIVRLDGTTAGGRVAALATTSSEAGSEGSFEFQGIPEGTFQLTAAHPTTPQRAAATAAITATSPTAVIDMVLEPLGDRWFRLFEKRKAGNTPASLSSGVFSVRLLQGSPPFASYDFAQLSPAPGTDRFLFPNVLVARSGGVSAEELTGERRKAGASFASFTGAPPVAGSGTSADPYQLVLSPKGVVRVSVRNAAGQPAAGANVTLHTSGGAFPSVTGADGTVTFAAVPAGGLNATASSLATGTSGFATGTLTFDDDLIEMTVALAPAVAAHGVVYQPVPDDRWSGDPAQLVPAPSIIVEIRDAKNRTQLVLTDERGAYRFAGLATGGYALTARSQNGDQLASVAGTLAGPDGNDNEVPALILDASPPRLLSIAPPPGFEGVSRTAAVELVFSEPLLAGVLPVNRSNPAPFFALRSAAGAAAPGVWNSSLDESGRQVVRFVPSTPYDNFTVYSLTVAGGTGGVRDRMGRPLTVSGNVGSNFKTSDSVGPAVIATNPDLGRPVDPAVPVRFDFSEALLATDEQLDGDFSGDALELFWEHDTGTAREWRRLPVVTFLTRSNFSLVMQPVEGIALAGDTLRRRVLLSGLEDVYGNVMPAYERTFRIYDEHAPRIDAVPFPPSAPAGQLLQGERYAIAPLLSALDDLAPANPGGDVDRVDYFFEDPTDPTRPVSPAFSAKTHPFGFAFVGAYVGDGVAPRPFPVWVQAVDTSTNKSNVVLVDMVVLPNTDPSIETVGVAATAPVPGVPYAGSTLLATVGGFFDLDGSQLTLFVELWREGAGAPMAATSGKLVTRPAGGWSQAASQTAPFSLPLDIEEGTQLFVRARVIDSNGAVGSTESDRFAVADDAAPAEVEDFSAHLAGAPVTHLFIGEEFVLEVKARDQETAIKEVVLELDRTDLFPDALALTKVPGTPDIYRSATLTVPPGMSEPLPVTARVRIDDWGGNSVERTAHFHVGPERDPYEPQARWHLPWQGALWPADYTSTVSSTAGATLLVRFFARDTNADADGNPVPGRLVTVQFRGPAKNPETGAIEPAAGWVDAVQVPGSEELAGATYQGLWRVPNGIPVGTEVPFEVRLVDSAGTEVVKRVTMTAVAARRVYEAAVTAAAAADPMLGEGGDPEGPVFLLDGTTLSIVPQPEGEDGRPVRRVGGLFLFAGAADDTGALEVEPTVLTAPEITTFDSAILFHPLELAVDHEIGVSVLSRIDMSRRGLLGSTSTRSMVLPGETGAQARAGGSHGGEGWFGSPLGGWNRTGLALPGSVFDSLRDPHLPGGGGGSADGNPGGTGGGVIRLFAPGARVRLDGEIAADGGNGTGGASGGGAGGAIRLDARRLEGRGRIHASGGGGTFWNTTGGGGGGRISLAYRELAAAFDLAAQVEAAGGVNDAPVPSRADRRAGAGTVFVEALDLETGAPAPGRRLLENPLEPVRPGLTPLPALGDGTVASIDPAETLVVLDVPRVRGDVVGDTLVLAAADGTPLGGFPVVAQRRVADAAAPGGFRVHLTVAATPEQLDPAAAALAAGAVAFHGRSRLAGVEVEASVRLLADDDLLLGPEGAPVLNDRSAVVLRRGARAALRGEAPAVVFTATPPAGTDLLLGSSATLSWEVTDPLGLVETKTENTFAPAPAVQNHFDEQLSVKSASPTTLAIPIGGGPESVGYTVEAKNTAGRVTRATAAWPVLPNAPPTGQVVLAEGTATPVRAGYPFSVVVQAADRERLLRVTLTAAGPVTPATQATTVTGTTANVSFTLSVPATADGSQPIVLQALLEDASGGSAATAAFEVPVAANGAPVGTLQVAPGAPATIEAGRSTTVVVHAEDADGLARIDLHVAGAVTQPEQSQTLSGNPPAADATFTVAAAPDAAPQTLSVTATIHDRFGSSSTTAALLIEVVENGAPAGTVALAAGAPDRLEPGQSTTVVVEATDPDGVAQIDLHAAGEEPGAVTEPEQSRTVSGTTVLSSFTLTAAAGAAPQAVTVTATLRDAVGSTATTAPLTFQIVADVDGPVVTITLDPDRGPSGVYRPGETVTVGASATDDVGVTSLELVVDGATTTSTGAPVSTVWTVPDLTAPTSFTFEATATDGDGHEGRATRTVEAAPAPADPPPTVAFTCPGGGAVLPDDYVVSLGASASDDAGVAAVRFYLGDASTPFAEVLPIGAPPLQTTASASFDLATALGPAVRFRVEATDTAGQTASQVIEVQAVPVVDLKADGQGTNDWAALEDEIVALRGGTLTLDQPVVVGGLLVLNGANVTHTAAPGATSPRKVDVTVSGPLYVGCGGSIDVSARGYAAGVTYPAHALPGHCENGGSHLGEGGPNHGTGGETYGSVYFPRENGGGGRCAGRGGGAVRIAAARVQVDGAIRANGQSATPAGAGGSVWIDTGSLAGAGAIEATGGKSGCCGDGSGGGGAIAVHYGTLETGATLPGNLRAQGGATQTQGGAGTIYLRRPGEAYGELIVDQGAAGGARRTVLPALGKGTAQSGSAGATLVSGRAQATPTYFVGHWVEVRNTAGVLEGTWRVASIGSDGFTVTLASEAGEPVTVDPGDAWQGVYRFDRLTVRGSVRLDSDDPIRVTGEQVVDGPVETSFISAERLVLKSGSVVTHHFTPSAAAPESLTIEVGELVVEPGAVIDVSARGYAASVTHLGHDLPAHCENGGSHLGEGGPNHLTAGETFGSVYFPRESGGGGRCAGRGGGVVRITAERVQMDGTIRANGENTTPAAAGGSVWIETGSLAGTGAIEAKGGNSGCCGDGSGGGGAIAVHYGTLEAGATLLGSLAAHGGATQTQGGAGTVLLKNGADLYGELIVDNGAVGGNRRTVLPALGKGVAQQGSAGAVLVTGRSEAIPAYFTGHWVEVRNAAGVLEGTWRVASIGADGFTVTLASEAGEPVTVDPGDAWQGVYRFDRLTVRGSVRLDSDDPIRVTGEQVVAGPLETSFISAGRLVIKPGAVLTQHFTSSSAAPESLTIEAAELVIEAGGLIDVSARGYAAGVTHAGHDLPAHCENGGSHLGEGGPNHLTAGETFGSVYFPRENGGGGRCAGRGGGVVRIAAGRVQVDGAIRANGQDATPAAAGGSVWIETLSLAGTGAIEAKGGNSGCCGDGSGGGGAIAVHYGTLDAGATLLGNLTAQGGGTQTQGGAGTVYVKSGGDSYGELIVDNGAVGGNRRTVLPALGKGTAQAGSAASTLVTGRSEAIPAYFVGHWVEVRNAAGVLEGTWRVASIGADGFTVTLAPNAGEPVTVDEGDAWQGIYRLDRYTVRGDVEVVSPDPIRVVSEQVVTGFLETTAIRAGRLVIKSGAVVTQHFTPSAAAPERLTIEVGELVVEAGGAIDVSARGYAAGVTHAGHDLPEHCENGGSHLGEGGPNHLAAGETYGSVYFPRENGGGGRCAGRGGGAVRITAERVQVDGAIRANGQDATPAAAGGSVWIETVSLAGMGVIEATGGNSGCCGDGSGGGGAIAVHYGTLEAGSTLLGNLAAQGGGTQTQGGAGTILVKSGADGYGELIVDNGTVGGNRRTVLPALGKGVAQQGSAGAVLVTGRSEAIPAYFVGHWVEVRDAATGVLEGTWRVQSIGIDGVTVILASNAGEPVTVDEGDAWQGIYRFDRYTVRGDVEVVSPDPIRVLDEQVITGLVETRAIRAGRLVIKPGAVLTQHFTPSSTAPESLLIEVGELVVETGGAIDVSARGYAANVTHAGHDLPAHCENGGSHLGEGGPNHSTAGETFGSVYFPRENGGGGRCAGRGGGTVRITAERVQVDGAIRANGQDATPAAAGGSVWIETLSLAGTGAIEAKGGNSGCCGDGSGGGGAIAVHYGTLEAGSTLLGNLAAPGGGTQTQGGAGTVYAKSGTDTYGELIVDNGAVGGNRRTVLPALGKGVAQQGSAGVVLVTGRSEAIPAYFTGHWVEVRNAAGVLEGTWRIQEIGADGFTVTLASDAGEPVTVDAGDAWQGIYRFDRYTVRGQLQVLSPDPIHVFSEQVITGTVETDAIHAESLVVRPGAVLTQHLTPSAATPQSLTIEVGELLVEAGGVIDVSARGYPAGVGYPGIALPAHCENGGSHLGEGGPNRLAAGETFGSVYFPRENGGGGRCAGRGGGAVRITAESVRVDGAIRANGQDATPAGAGGSVWVQTTSLAGSGLIEARGGNSGCCGDGSGGGGAIAIQYGSVDPAATLLDNLNAQGGSTQTTGGAGTVYLFGPSATLGSLTVDNKLVAGKRRTVLPPLGRGVVQAGSSGGTIVTGRDADVPGYFLGSWVEVEGPDRFVKGVWRIASISGATITLEPKPSQPFTIAPGDRWRGLYRFDAVTVADSSVLVSTDPVVQLVPPLPEESTGRRAVTAGSFEALYGNGEAPAWDKTAIGIAVGAVAGSYRVVVAPGAVADPDGIAEVLLSSGGRWLAADWSAEGVTFLWPGRPGQRLHLVATDAHDRFRRSGWLELPPLPDGGWAPLLELAPGVTPLAVEGGADWLALADEGVWLYGEVPQPAVVVPPRAADEEVVALAAGEASLFIATRERLDVYDRAAQSVVEVPAAGGALLDVVAGESGTTVLLADGSDPAATVLRLAELLRPEGEPPAFSLPSEAALPALGSPALLRTPGHLHLFGLDPEDGAGVVATWPSAAPGEAILAAPETWELPAGWHAVGPWSEGAVVLQGTAAALLRYAAGDWAEVARVELGVEAFSAAVAGATLVVLVPGEIVLFDLTDPAAPALLGRHPGSAFRRVEPLPDGQVLLWSPRLAAPPLRWDPATAVPGVGFQTVIEGLP